MAKIKPNNFLDTVNELIGDATRKGILHLYAEGQEFTGRRIGINGKSLLHFGTTGYLGLEQEPRLKNASITAIQQYGTQFPLSKSYISHPLYRELEDLVEQMYGYPVIITKNSTLGHLGTIPSLVRSGDAIILDHQVHWSVQSACQVLKSQGVAVDMIRHNHLGMLEDRIKFHSARSQRIWYMADGIYSMYGDCAPVKELVALTHKYPRLHLYFDDVHGMGWIGKNGTGYVMDQLGSLPERVLVFGTLSKTFGASGAVLVCPDREMHQRIKAFGGPLTFSAQLEPAAVGAAIASANIHLSPEIYWLQQDLRKRIDHFNSLLGGTDLPVVDPNESPVFYVGTGMPETGYCFVNRLMAEGFYVNLGMFPAVPVKNTGVRITISRHNQTEDIEALVDAMVYHFPKALEDSHTDLARVRKVFGLGGGSPFSLAPESGLRLLRYGSITEVDRALWDSTLGNRGLMDWEGMKFLESAFSNNPDKAHNWTFNYLVILDGKGVPVLVTFMTGGLWKDDMLSPVEVSRTLEEERLEDPYHLCSTVLSLGCLFTEGNHLFLDRDHPLEKRAVHALFGILEVLEQELECSMVVLRDFGKEHHLQDFFIGQGFIKVRMPDSCTMDLGPGKDLQGHIAGLSPRNRRHLRKEILAHEPDFRVEVLEDGEGADLERISQLYDKVRQHNLGLNTFPFPEKIFALMAAHPQWEFLCLYLKGEALMVGVMLCYKNAATTYVPAFVGMDYRFVHSHHTYRQLLYQTVKRALSLNCQGIDFGLTAAFEKRKLGATITETFAFIQSPDNYRLELLGLMEGQSKS